MGKTFQVSQGEEMIAHPKFRYVGGGGLYDIQVRLGSRKGKDFYPEQGLEWTLEGVAVLQRGINTFDLLCPVPYVTPAGNYDSELSIRIPGLPYPENREVIAYKDNAVHITQKVVREIIEEV